MNVVGFQQNFIKTGRGGGLENQEPTIVETGCLAATRGGQMALGLLQELIPRKLVFDLSNSFLEDPTYKTFSIRPDSRAHSSVKNFSLGHLSKTIKGK